MFSCSVLKEVTPLILFYRLNLKYSSDSVSSNYFSLEKWLENEFSVKLSELGEKLTVNV